jgi:protein required for attachment to host cells
MPNTWLVVANASQATIYQTEQRPKTLSLVKEMLHPPSREKGEQLASDRAGHYQGEAVGMEGTTHGAFNEPTDPKSFEHERFASDLAKELEAGRTANSFKHLIIVASPHFHGLLNKSMNSHLGGMVTQHIQKDYTSLDQKELLTKF